MALHNVLKIQLKHHRMTRHDH